LIDLPSEEFRIKLYRLADIIGPEYLPEQLVTWSDPDVLR
jgi:hypothetical protein